MQQRSSEDFEFDSLELVRFITSNKTTISG